MSRGGSIFNVGQTTKSFVIPHQTKKVLGGCFTMFVRLVSGKPLSSPPKRGLILGYVLEMSRHDTVAGIYLSTKPEMLTGALSYVLNY